METHSSVLAWRILGTGGTWWAAVYGVAQSRPRLKRLSSSSSFINECTNMYVESRKMLQMNLFTGQEQRHRCREQACGPRVGEGDKLGRGTDTHATRRATGAVGSAGRHGRLSSGLWAGLEGGVVGGRLGREGAFEHTELTHAAVHKNKTSPPSYLNNHNKGILRRL